MDEIGPKFHPDVGQFLADPAPHASERTFAEAERAFDA
jgi:hypothetical protein